MGFGLSSVDSTLIPDPNSPNEEKWQSVIDLARSVHDAGIGVGDILYIPTPGKEHVALIVGWGPPFRSWTEFLDSSVSVNYNYKEGDVPYIVDHGLQRWVAAQPSGRPYYFLAWSPSYGASNDLHKVSKWTFETVPSVVCKSSNDVITFEEAMTKIERE